LPEQVAKFLSLTPEEILDLPIDLWDADAHNVVVLGILLTVGYKSMDECYDVLKIVLLSVTLPIHVVERPAHVYKYKKSLTKGSQLHLSRMAFVRGTVLPVALEPHAGLPDASIDRMRGCESILSTMCAIADEVSEQHRWLPQVGAEAQVV
jgi:hypothetical protein